MLTTSQISHYETEGYLLVPEALGAPELDTLRNETEALFGHESPARVMETDGQTVRGVHGCHLTSPVFAEFARDPRLLVAARQVVGADVYIHQSKINAKRALRGDVWPWHQDFVFWESEDGMAAPRVVNVAVFLDAATDINGPLLVIPGSHRSGSIEHRRAEPGAEGGSWRSHLAAALKYTLDQDDVSKLSESRGIAAMTAPAGSLLFFDSRIVHASGANMSPYDRRMAILTYNDVENAPAVTADSRPEFLSARDPQPLRTAGE